MHVVENIALTLKERAFVKEQADNRESANEFKKDIADYKQSRFNLTGLQANRLGVFAEAAAFKWLGGDILNHSLEEWAHFVPNNHPDYTALIKGQADLFGSVEVRRANKPTSPIPIRAKDRENGSVIVSVYVPYRQALPTPSNPHPPIVVGLEATILGWAYVTDEGKRPDWATGTSDTIVVPPRSVDTFPAGVLKNA